MDFNLGHAAGEGAPKTAPLLQYAPRNKDCLSRDDARISANLDLDTSMLLFEGVGDRCATAALAQSCTRYYGTNGQSFFELRLFVPCPTFDFLRSLKVADAAFALLRYPYFTTVGVLTDNVGEAGREIRNQ